MAVIDFILMLLFAFRDNFESAVLIIAVVSLFIYQIINTRDAKKEAKKTKEIANDILRDQRTTISSISRHMSKIVRKSATINRELDKIVYTLGADRGFVYLFHNSGHNFLGQPFAKVSNTNESLAPGVGSLIDSMTSMKDIPVGILACYIEELLVNNEVRFSDAEDYKEHDRTTYERFKSLGIKSTYAVTMFSSPPECYFISRKNEPFKTEIPLGFVGVDFTREKRELTDTEMELLRSASLTIKGLLIEQRREEIESEGYTFLDK